VWAERCFNSWRRWILIENGNEMDYVNAVETLIENIKKKKAQKCPVKIPSIFYYGNLESLFIGQKRIFVVSINSPLETN
jgi:hypothetical protein